MATDDWNDDKEMDYQSWIKYRQETGTPRVGKVNKSENYNPSTTKENESEEKRKKVSEMLERHQELINEALKKSGKR